MKNKKLFIVVYANFGIINEVAESVHSSSFADECNFVIVPQKDDGIKVECINPVLLTEEKYKDVEDTVNKLKEALKQFKKDEK